MKKHIEIISVIIFVSFFMFISNSCNNNLKKEHSEAYLEADSCYNKAIDLLKNDSMTYAFPKLIKTLSLLESLPEDMSRDENLIVSKAYHTISQVFFTMEEPFLLIETNERAINYQKFVNDSNLMAQQTADMAIIYAALGDFENTRYYIDLATPYLDTVSDFVEPYLKTRTSIEYLLWFEEKYDSSFLINQQNIYFKHRRGMDTKNDSLGLGISMYDANFRQRSKPYLLKVFDIKEGDIQPISRGLTMQYLASIYEEENNLDSVAICREYFEPYVAAQFDRRQEIVYITKLYNDYKAERDSKINSILEQRAVQKRNIKIFAITLLVIAVVALFIVIISNKNKKKINKQKVITGSALQQHVHTIFRNQKNNVYQNILKEFSAVYPDAYEKFQNAHTELTETEQAICLLSFFSFRRKEISIILNIQENTVSKYRNSIVKKIGTTEIEDIMKDYL